MSRYFFNVFDGKNEILDTVGVECDGIRDARVHMLNVAMHEMTTADPQKDIWSMEVLNDRGLIVGSIDFGILSSTEYRGSPTTALAGIVRLAR